MKKIPVGILQNNPCNICKGSNWKGLVPSNNRFCAFSHRVFGIRAFLIVFRTYVLIHHIYSVRGFVNRFAPKGDGNNNPDLYVAFILDRWRTIGFDVSQTDSVFDESWFSLNFTQWNDKQLLFYCFVCSVCKMETGYELPLYLFEDAYLMI